MIRPSRRLSGFTLVEMIIVIVITGIIAAIVAVFIRAPMQGFIDLETRVELTDTADTALRRIGRDMRLALPNSVRPTGSSTALEFLQTRTGGRYRGEVSGTAGAQGNALYPGETSALSFDVFGDLTLGGTVALPVAGERVVIYNLGIPGADAYNADNSASISAATANSITLSAATLFPLASPGMRFQVVETPVTYRCDLTAGTLVRHWGYAITSSQVNPPSGGSSAILAQNVSGCTFTYNQINERYGLVTMQLVLTKNNETVTLYHEVHVSNVP